MTKLLKKNILITLFATLMLSVLVALAFSFRPTGIVKADESATDEAKLLFSLDFDDEEADGKYLEGHSVCETDDKIEIRDSKAYMHVETGRSRHFFINIPAEYFLNYSNLIISFDMEGYAANSDVNVFDDASNDAFLLRAFHANFGDEKLSYIERNIMSFQWFKNYRVSENSHRYVVNYTSSEIDRSCFNNANLKYISFGFYVSGEDIKSDFTFTVDNFKVYEVSDFPFAESQSEYVFNDTITFSDSLSGNMRVMYSNGISAGIKSNGIDSDETDRVYWLDINFDDKTISYEYADDSADSGRSSKIIYENGAWFDEKYKEISFTGDNCDNLFVGNVDWFKNNVTKTQKYVDLKFYAKDGETLLGSINKIPACAKISDYYLSNVIAPEIEDEVFMSWQSNDEQGESPLNRYAYEMQSLKAVYSYAVNVTVKDGEEIIKTAVVGGETKFSDVIKDVSVEKVGYAFLGFALAEDGEPTAELTEVTEDVTLYAVYKINTYTIKIMNGDTLVKEYVQDYNTTISKTTLKSDLFKYGYILKGISDSPNSKLLEISDITVTENATYYADYEKENVITSDRVEEPAVSAQTAIIIIAASAIALIAGLTVIIIKKRR